MTYYLLPRTSYLIHNCIDYIEADHVSNPAISISLSTYLYEIKEKLDRREKDWDIFKKYTNHYEYIHTIVPFKKKSVSSHKPLSRSYFKMIEMMNVFHFHFDSKPISTFHLAEGPGGFIEAIAQLRNCKYDNYVGMTILDDDDHNIPAWKKSDRFLNEHKNVTIESGADNTGNILSLSNFVHCKNKYGSTMDFITADGGFDFSVDFNSQETNITKLLFAQICFALSMQKKGGIFILKIFDCFMQSTVDLMYILSSFYEKVYIIKPQTSRYANSEKYIVCKGFIFSTSAPFYSFLHNTFEKMVISTEITPNHNIHRFLSTPVSYYFSTKLEEYNAIFGQQQIENIHYTISLIDNKHKQEKIDTLIKLNVQKCINWCMKYNVPYNTLIPSTNVFLNQETANSHLVPVVLL
jgi:23S rRNA U2552 (ribose-2'-O)-methylase RlmE/FtsJ